MTPPKPMKILSIDFDMFFPVDTTGPDWQLYDWGHSESHGKQLLELLWVIRAAAFMEDKGSLPGTILTDGGMEEKFWGGFQFSPKAKLYLMDSHRFAVHPLLKGKAVSEVWNLDAHHDMGYSQQDTQQIMTEGVVHCGDWLAAYKEIAGAKVHVRYPYWAAKKMELESPMVEPYSRNFLDFEEGPEPYPVFDAVFFARSPHWTPTLIDYQYWDMVEACPLKNPIYLEEMEHRELDMQAVEEHIQQNKTIREMHKIATANNKNKTVQEDYF
jgi:hypothetical protein